MRKHIIRLALISLFALTHSPLMAQELGDGTYLCEGGISTGLKALNRQWTPVGAPVKDYLVVISDNSQKAEIDGMSYDCQTRFFEFLGCTTGLYHFGMNLTNGRFIFDQSYGFIRGETPGGDAEIVTTTLGFCAPAPQS